MYRPHRYRSNLYKSGCLSLFLVFPLLFLFACTPREQLQGGTVIWQSTDNEERVIQVGPCVKTQTYYSGEWYTTHTECAVGESNAP